MLISAEELHLYRRAKALFKASRNSLGSRELAKKLRQEGIELTRYKEDSLYEIESMRRFAGLRLSGRIPDETTILNFRHFVEKHKFGKRLFDSVQDHLDEQGLKLQEGSIVDAGIISARPLPRTKAVSETLKCTRQRKEMNGISA